jgi:hypothetical protein
MLKEKFKELYALCKSECENHIEATELVKKQFKNLYGFELKGTLFYNEYNLIIEDYGDARFFLNIMPPSSLVAQITIPEFDSHLFIIRYATDGVLSSIFVQ